jgi:internalin A
LFIRAYAVFILLWAKDTENDDEYEQNGIRLRNYPLQYWVEYVRHLGDSNSPVLIVQTKCDEKKDEVRRFPIEQELLEALGYSGELHYSAKNERGHDALNEALCDAIRWLRNPHRAGTATIGSVRLRVQRRLIYR